MRKGWGIVGLWATCVCAVFLGTLVNYDKTSVEAGGPPGPGLYAEWLYPHIIPAPRTPKIHPALRYAKKLPLRAYIEIQRPNMIKFRRKKPKKVILVGPPPPPGPHGPPPGPPHGPPGPHGPPPGPPETVTTTVIHHGSPPSPPGRPHSGHGDLYGPPPPSHSSPEIIHEHEFYSSGESLPPSSSFDVVSVNGDGGGEVLPYGPPPNSPSFTGGPPPSPEDVYVSPPSPTPIQFTTSVDTSSPFIASNSPHGGGGAPHGGEGGYGGGGGAPLSSLYEVTAEKSSGLGGGPSTKTVSVFVAPEQLSSSSGTSGIVDPKSIYTKGEVGPLSTVPGQLEPGYRYIYKSPALTSPNETSSSYTGNSNAGNTVTSGIQDLYRTLPKVSLVRDANDDTKVNFLFDGKFLVDKNVLGVAANVGGAAGSLREGGGGGGISLQFGAGLGLNQGEPQGKKVLQDESIWDYEKYDESIRRESGSTEDLDGLGSSPKGTKKTVKSESSEIKSSSREFLISKLLKQLMEEELDEREKRRISKGLDIYGDRRAEGMSSSPKMVVVDPIGKVIRNAMLGEFLVHPEERNGDLRLTLSGSDRSKFYFETNAEEIGSRVYTDYPDKYASGVKCLTGKRAEGSEVVFTKSCNEVEMMKEVLWNILPIQDGRFWIQQKGTNFCLQPSVDLSVPTFVEMKSCDLYEPYQFWEISNAIPKY